MIARGRNLCEHAGAMNMQAGAAPDTFVGRVLAEKFRVVSLLGEGGMGAVYLGEQTLGTAVRKVAIKTLHAHLSHDPQIRARFEREVGTVAGLEHPNTIQVYDYGQTPEGLLYIVMEYVQGKSLADILEKEGAMGVTRMLHIMTQVCGSLDEAHRAGIVHRDLKPDNIVLCEKAGQKDWVEVLDFGIAKRGNENDPNEAKLTQQGMVLGTPPYMSPEQFTGQPIGPQSDIYSLCVMTYEMLTGRMPYNANTAWEWASQHMTAQPFPFEGVPSGAALPMGLRAAVLRGLEKNPQSRYASVIEYLEQLKRGAAEALGAPLPPAPPPPPPGGARTEVAQAVPMQSHQYGAAPTPGPMAAYGAAPPSVQGGQYGANPNAGYGAQAPNQGYGAPQNYQGQQHQGPQAGAMMAPNNYAHQPKKSNAGLIIGILFGGLLLAGGVVAAVLVMGSKSDSGGTTGGTTPIAPVSTPAVTASATATATAEPADTGLPSLSSGTAAIPVLGKVPTGKPTTPVKPGPPIPVITVAPPVTVAPPPVTTIRPVAVDPNTVIICGQARAALASNNPNAASLVRKCKMGGGSNLL